LRALITKNGGLGDINSSLTFGNDLAKPKPDASTTFYKATIYAA